MRDIVDRQVFVGDIVAFGSPNRGSVELRIVADIRERGERKIEEVFVRGVSKIVSKYDMKTKKWLDIEPYMQIDRGGWTFHDRIMVINESAPKEITNFLREAISEQTK